MLNYVKNVDSNFGSYIAQWIDKIRSDTDIKQWNYIRSSFNVADDATKCIDASKLQSENSWFVGPDFLYKQGFPIYSESTEYQINAGNKSILHNNSHIGEIKNTVKQSSTLCKSVTVSDINNSLINWTNYLSLDKSSKYVIWPKF